MAKQKIQKNRVFWSSVEKISLFCKNGWHRKEPTSLLQKVQFLLGCRREAFPTRNLPLAVHSSCLLELSYCFLLGLYLNEARKGEQRAHFSKSQFESILTLQSDDACGFYAGLGND